MRVRAAPPLGRERALPEKLLVSPDEAAELLSIGRTYLYELLRTGEIRSVQVGRLRRVPAAALHEYVEKLSTSGWSSVESRIQRGEHETRG